MRVLHVTPHFAPAWSYGGIPRAVEGLCRALAARGHHNAVVTTDAFDAGARRSAEADEEARRRASLSELLVLRNLHNGAAWRWQLFLPAGPWAPVREAVARADVVHVHGHRNLLELGASWLALRLGRPLVFSGHGTAVNIERRRALKAAADRLGAALPLHRAARVVALSEAERRDLERLGVRRDRVRVVPNGIDAAAFELTPALRAAARARLGLGARPVVLFLGKVTPRKCLPLLVEALARVPARPALLLAGSDMGGVEAAVRLARRRGVELVATGPVDDAGRREALAAADLVAYPGWGEVFGLAAFEALAAGRPVVVAGDHGCGEWIEVSGGGWVVPPRDARALAQAVAAALADPGAAARRAAAGQRFVRESLGWDAVAEATEQVYAEATGLRAARSRPRHAAAPRALPALSVVVPVRDGMATLPRLLDALRQQRPRRVRLHAIVAVDSGSTDGSAAFLAAQPDVRLLHEQPGAFDHGRTRARAAASTDAELVVFLSQDAVPQGAGFLDALAAPLLDDARVAGSYARQVPWAHHDALARARVRRWLAGQPEARVAGPEALAAAADPVARREAANFDNVASCVRAARLRERPFQSAPFAEDLEWSLQMLRDGHRIAYVPEAVVRHSHASSLRAAFHRARLDHGAQRRLLGVEVQRQHHGGGPAAPLRHFAQVARTYAAWSSAEAGGRLPRPDLWVHAALVAAAEVAGVACA